MTQYIDKSALVAEIERIRRIEVTNNDVAYNGALDEIRYFLDTIEVKEVDLDKEIKKVQYQYKTIGDYDGYPATVYANDIETIAKHFFELRLKVQKGEL